VRSIPIKTNPFNNQLRSNTNELFNPLSKAAETNLLISSKVFREMILLLLEPAKGRQAPFPTHPINLS
jgi:hypothetical protein